MHGTPLPRTDADITAKRIGARARAIREELGRSAMETAFLVGVSAEGLTALEAGARLPTLAQLYRLAGALSVPTGDLLPGLWERPRIDLHLPITAEPGSSTAQIVGGGPGNPTQTFLFELRAGEGDGGFDQHPGDELLVVTDGEVVVSEEGRPDEVVRAGGSRRMDTSGHHAVRGGGPGLARFLLVCTDVVLD
jgi:transcriptional regulator with XRE-family HTH domain